MQTNNLKRHPAWLIFWISFGCLGGIALALVAGNYFSHISWLIAALALLCVVFMNRSRKIIILAIAAGLILGLWRGSVTILSEQAYEAYIGERVVLQGTVAEDTAFSTDGDQRVKLKNIQIENQSVNGTVWVSTSDNTEIKRSDTVVFSGLLSEGFGSFAAVMFRADLKQILQVEHADIAREVRDWFADGVRKVIPEPEASLGIGYLTGQHSTLPEDLDNNLKLLGLTHIVVASGYNLTILVRFARRAFARISKYLATLVTSLLVFSFVLVTGFSPSMSRAALITGLSLAAWYFGRRIHPIILLGFAAAVTAMLNPAYIWGDIGWYLSFTAFAGVIIVSPLLLHYFWGKIKKVNPIHQVFLETLSAQIMTAPLIAYIFNQYSALALPANLLILLFIPLTMLLTFFAGSFSLAFGTLTIFGWPANALLSYMTTVVDKLAILPIALAETDFSLAAMIASYCAILVFIIYIWRRTRHDFLGSPSVVE
ncbi:ComEC/Rec2 family competence protein [Candidatus Parcubacteria bacterium]|nr:ComEC/Rec2 family competence protein [Candidatus Parcubacteria bacterium]